MLMKNRQIVFLLILLSITSIFHIGLVNAVSPGVSSGNEFIYEVKTFYKSDNQSAIIPQKVLEINKTDYFKIEITKVDGNSISFKSIWKFINGTEIEGPGSVDISTGMAIGDFWAISSSNMNAGNKLYPTGPDRVFINDTIIRNYESYGDRETNLVDITYTYYDEDDPSKFHNQYSKTYFDKQTGILIELEDLIVFPDPLTTEKLKWELIDTNSWTNPEVPTTIIFGAISLVIIGIIGIIIYKKYKK